MGQRKEIKLRKLDYIVEPLLEWFDVNKRSLPWRDEPGPYRVWVSEIMLQQTRVEAVKPYFERFLVELPDVESLARAGEERLLKLWEGLGYYNRVRNMQKAALQVVEEHGGKIPSDYEELLKLKGIGSYTAGAIASIAFGQKIPAVDGNVLRVLSRLTMDKEDIAQPSVKKRVESELVQVMPDRAGDFNQALMELGAIVCLPNGAPKCELCPWRGFCEAHIAGRTDEFPYKSAKAKRKVEKKTVLIIKDDRRILLHRRPSKGLLAGMYEFPMMDRWASGEEIIEHVRWIGCEPLHIEPIQDGRHIFSHKEWHMKGYFVKVEPFGFRTEAALLEKDYILAHTETVRKQYPMPSAFAVYAQYMSDGGSQ